MTRLGRVSQDISSGEDIWTYKAARHITSPGIFMLEMVMASVGATKVQAARERLVKGHVEGFRREHGIQLVI
jgi:hypothetical protein